MGIKVKKFGLALLVLLILGIAIFIAMVSYGGGQRRWSDDGLPSGAVNGTGIPGGQRDRVIAVALADSVVQNVLNSCDNKSKPEYILPSETGVYVNDSGRYAGVLLNATAGPRYVGSAPGAGQLSMMVIIDVSTMKEMGVVYRGIASFMNSWIIVPPGNGIYQKAWNYYNNSVPEISMGDLSLTPLDAQLYPVVVDEDNFKKYANGTSYQALEVIDLQTGDRIIANGSTPVTSRWKAYYFLTPETQSYDKNSGFSSWYFILSNPEDSQDVKVTYISPKPVIYDY